MLSDTFERQKKMHNVDYYKINSVVSPSYSVTKTMKFIKQCSYIAATIHVQDTIANLNTMCISLAIVL